MNLEPKAAQVTLPPFQTAHGNVTSRPYDRDRPLKTLPFEGLSRVCLTEASLLVLFVPVLTWGELDMFS